MVSKFILPHATFRVYWDLTGLVLLSYYLFSIPLFVGFVEHPTFAPTDTNHTLQIWALSNFLADLFFLVDIYLHFTKFAGVPITPHLPSAAHAGACGQNLRRAGW